MANRKNSQIRSKVEQLVDIMFSDAGIPEESMSRIRAWLVDPDREQEKSDALKDQFNRIFKFDPQPALAVKLWPELARRLGMNETPTVTDKDPLDTDGTECDSTSTRSKPPVKVYRKASTGVRRTLWPRKTAARVVAVLAPILVVGGVAMWLARERTTMIEISVPVGETRNIELPDGSVVKAQGGTTIAYDGADFAARRMVTLSGEAMFDVEQVLDGNGAKVPFAVESDNLTVNVLGTIFKFAAGAEGAEEAAVSLYEGSVAVKLEDDAAEEQTDDAGLDTVLGVGERLEVNILTGEHSTELIPASEMAELGFMPLLRFDEATLGDLTTSLGMNHGVKFNIAEGIDTAGGRYSGDFADLPLDEVLGMLSRIDTALSFEMNGDGEVDVKHK